jgi:Tol biopolymer transport system component
MAAGVLVLAGRAHSAAPTIGGGRILVTVFSEPCCGLMVIDEAGVQTIAIGAPDPSLDQSAWAGPGQVVFTSLRANDGRRHIFEVAAGGGRPRRVPVGRLRLSQQWPSVSTDGREIAYTEANPATSIDHGLYVAGIDGRDAHQVAPPARANDHSGWGEPQLSPSGNQVLVVSRIFDRDAGRATLWLVPGAPRNLTAPGLDAGYPRFSPDGRRILFSQWFHRAQLHGPGLGPLWAIGTSGATIARPLTDHPPGSWSYEGDWSPDGSRIVYLYHRPGWDHNQLRIVNADGSHDHAVWTAPSGTFAAVPDWGS